MDLRPQSTRSAAARDAVTVEIVFALVTGLVLAGAVFAVGAVTAWYLGLPDLAPRVAAVAAGVAFVVRVVRVLWRFPRPSGRSERPGRTGSDS
ncbi:DUF6332 family protein [Streptomyces sp. NPDC095613]|uniref:DUF6332 family protein n=1 Tax=Streptomyces sp. NPDC095613 TaxID=3155540 RepID=UPI003327F4F4